MVTKCFLCASDLSGGVLPRQVIPLRKTTGFFMDAMQVAIKLVVAHMQVLCC